MLRYLLQLQRIHGVHKKGWRLYLKLSHISTRELAADMEALVLVVFYLAGLLAFKTPQYFHCPLDYAFSHGQAVCHNGAYDVVWRDVRGGGRGRIHQTCVYCPIRKQGHDAAASSHSSLSEGLPSRFWAYGTYCYGIS